jgi:hypothetical protein
MSENSAEDYIKMCLPEDGPVWPKHVAGNRMYFHDILKTFKIKF